MAPDARAVHSYLCQLNSKLSASISELGSVMASVGSVTSGIRRAEKKSATLRSLRTKIPPTEFTSTSLGDGGARQWYVTPGGQPVLPVLESGSWRLLLGGLLRRRRRRGVSSRSGGCGAGRARRGGSHLAVERNGLAFSERVKEGQSVVVVAGGGCGGAGGGATLLLLLRGRAHRCVLVRVLTACVRGAGCSGAGCT